MEPSNVYKAIVRVADGQHPVLILANYNPTDKGRLRNAFAIPLHGTDASVAKLTREFAEQMVSDNIGELEAVQMKMKMSTKKVDSK